MNGDNNHPVCLTCDYCQVLDGQRGLCRRLAPRPTVMMAEGKATIMQQPWPLVAVLQDWCGEYHESKVQVVKSIKLPGGP